MKKIFYKEGFKYQLERDYSCHVEIKPPVCVTTDFISLTPTGLLTIKKGYAWDGPSGPSVDTKNFMRGSLVHDALYQLLRACLLDEGLREAVDKELRKICLEDGMSGFRVWYVYHGLKWGGGPAANPKNKRKLLTAP